MQKHNLSSKNIVLGITGSIAVYKAAELVRLLKKKDCNVKVIMTNSAMEFVQPLTFQSLSQNTVYCDMFNQEQELNIGHISLAKWADLILIAPATANIIAKISNGIADDLLSTVCLAAKKPIAIAPAMNEAMWLNPVTQHNVEILKQRNMYIIGPDKGEQACGDNGPGRMLEPRNIVDSLKSLFIKPVFKNIRIMVTAGPTIEAIDPVRYLTNHSSGKMGYAIAEAAKKMGAKVCLISGPASLNPPLDIDFEQVKSASEMRDAVISRIKGVDIFISTAAVADYRPKEQLPQKHKKTDSDLIINFVKNSDILAEVAKLPSPPFTVGFSAETENLIANAKKKLHAKNIDMIAANMVGHGKGFDNDDNKIIVIDRKDESFDLGLESKELLAYKLLEKIFEYFKK